MDNKKAMEIIKTQKEKAEDLIKKVNFTSSEFNAWKNTTKQLLSKIFGEESDNTDYFSDSQWFPHDILYVNGQMDERTANIKSLEYLSDILNSCIQQLEVELDEETVKGEEKMLNKKKVFVVHGRNEKIRKSMFDFLRAIGVEPIEWLEAKKLTKKPSPYIGEVLDIAFSKAQAIIVLFTPDDEAKLRDSFIDDDDPDYEKKLTPQARPNVIFEAGMALGRMEDRTIIIQFGELRKFSDIEGRHIIKFKDNTQKRCDLIDHLKIAGVDVNIEGKTDWLNEGDFKL